MGGLLGKNKKKISETPEVISRLKQERDKLNLYRQKTELELKCNVQQAKQLLQKGNREEAKTVIKKKIYHERQLQSSNAQLDKIDQITNELELARLTIELSNFGEKKLKRGKWKSIIKKKYKRQRNFDSRKKLGKPVHEDTVIQVLGDFNKKAREKRSKISEKTRNGIEKQQEISELISGQFNKGDEKAIEKELEAIMNSGYALPDMSQDTYDHTVRKPCESKDVTAISA